MNPADELQKRLDQKPDQWTLAWWNQQFQECLKGYRGATHAVNRSLAEMEDAQAAITALKAQIAVLEADREADRAKLGELQARVDRMAEFLTKVKQDKNHDSNRTGETGGGNAARPNGILPDEKHNRPGGIQAAGKKG